MPHSGCTMKRLTAAINPKPFAKLGGWTEFGKEGVLFMSCSSWNALSEGSRVQSLPQTLDPKHKKTQPKL